MPPIARPLPRLLPRAAPLAIALALAGPAAADPPELPGGDGAATEFPAKIGNLRLQGLVRTEPRVVEGELPWRPGDLVTREQWELGLIRLRNTNLFTRVEARLEGEPGARTAVLEFEEHITINPLIDYGVSGRTYWFRLGLEESNLLGRYLGVAAEYERFGRENGGLAWVSQPRLFGRRLGALARFEKLARPRPLFTDFRTLGHLELNGEPDDETGLGGWLEVFSDRFARPDDGPYALPAPGAGALLGGELRLGRVDRLRLRKRGFSVALRPSAAWTGDPERPAFAQGLVEILWFRLAGERWNFALRLQAAASTPAPAQHRFYAGGLDLVRGYRDNAFHGEGYAAANAEVRFTASEGTWLAFVPAVFVDAIAMRPDAPDAPRHGLSVGGGVRILVPKFVDMGGRFDLAVPLTGVPTLQPNLGVYQYF